MVTCVDENIPNTRRPLEIRLYSWYEPTQIEKYLSRQTRARGGDLGEPVVPLVERSDGVLYVPFTFGRSMGVSSRHYERRRGSVEYRKVPTAEVAKPFTHTHVHTLPKNKKNMHPVLQMTPEALVRMLRYPNMFFEEIAFNKGGSHIEFLYYGDKLSEVTVPKDYYHYDYLQKISRRLELRKASDFPAGLDYDYDKLRKDVEAKLLAEGRMSNKVIDDMLDFHVFKGK